VNTVIYHVKEVNYHSVKPHLDREPKQMPKVTIHSTYMDNAATLHLLCTHLVGSQPGDWETDERCVAHYVWIEGANRIRKSGKKVPRQLL